MGGHKNRKGNFKKVLLIHAKTGGGHYIASKSIQNYIEKNFKNVRVKNIDGLKDAYFPYPIMPFLWDLISEIPFLWKIVFYSFNIERAYKFTLFLQTLLLYPSLKKYVKSFMPDLIFITHPFYIPPLLKIKKKLKINFTLITVLTDFGEIHTSWLCEGSDFLWIPSKFTFNEIKNRLKNLKFEILGYPVRENFLKKEEYKREGILIMGGGKGKGPIFKIIKILIENFKDLNIRVICGKNKKLYKKILKFKKEKKIENIHPIGFTDRVAEYMKKSIILISKPGGSTVAEAIYSHTPLLAIDAVPGQEKGNVKFIESINAGKEIKDLKEIKEVVKKIISGEKKFEFKENLFEYEDKKKKFLFLLLS